MENNRGQSIFLSVVGIATLLVAIVGATFAYFSITVTGNDTASSIRVTTAKLGGVTYSGNSDKIEATNVYPGWSAQKTFTITSDSTMDSDARIDYDIVLRTTEDGLSSEAVTRAKNEFVYTLTGSQNNGGTGTLANVSTKTNMPTETSGTNNGPDTVIGQGTLVGSSNSHSYTFTVTLEETGSNQNDLQGLSYYGIIQIVVGGEDGQKRTYDPNEPGWKVWTPGA